MTRLINWSEPTKQSGFTDWRELGIIILIILISFFNYSERFYPLLNSDMAITILMSVDFSFPEDLYFWGQNRLGSLVSFLGYVLVKYLNIHPVLAVGIAKYGVLVPGYFGFAHFFHFRLPRLLLALIWFLPPWHEADFLLHVFGIQLSITGVVLFLLFRLIDALKKTNFIKAHFFIALSGIGIGIGLWVSDPFIITLVLLMLMVLAGIHSFFRKNAPISIRQLGLVILHFAIWLGMGFAFVYYAKWQAPVTQISNYTPKFLNNSDDFAQTVTIFFQSVTAIATFRSESLVESVYLYGIIVLIFGIIINWKKWVDTNKLLKNRVSWFFILNFFFFFGMVFLSNWVLQNEVARRYFTFAYAYAWISVLFITDQNYHVFKKQAVGYLFPVIIIGSLSGVVGFYLPKRELPKINILAGFNHLGEVGLIGEYWNSYVSMCPNPYKIKATACDTAIVRNKKLVQQTLSQPKVFLIKDMWLKKFPDMIFQFDTVLNKVGTPMEIGGAVVCEYKVENCRKFNCLDLELRSSCKIPLVDTTSVTGKVFVTDSNAFKSHFLFGPYISLNPGEYELKMRLKIDAINEERVLGFIDVAAKGNNILGARNINVSDFDLQDKFQDLSLDFKVDKPVASVEFRILYYGGPTLFFDFLRIYKK